MSICVSYHSDVGVSVNHSKDCLKFSNAEAKSRVKYIKRVYFEESKLQSEFKDLGNI